MRIFIAGGSGALGRRLVSMLVDAGHDVVATTRTPEKADRLRALGAEPVVLDALDRGAVMSAVTAAKPDVIVDELTALSGPADLRRFDRAFAQTNRLRTEGTDHLLAAARAAGTGRLLAQSYTGWPNPRTGGPVKTEDDPIDPHPTAASRESIAAIQHVESTVAGARDLVGVVLRYGTFYGPGTGLTAGGEVLEMERRRRLPLVGGGTGVWSFVHIDDAARATVAALEAGPGLYNIVDDEPAPVAEWLPYLARCIGARPPMRVPAWLARALIGEHGVSMMTAVRGSSNAKAKRELGWRPEYASWRQGFREGLN
jgi:nucleoside-diphosphate-sugar epimerase